MPEFVPAQNPPMCRPTAWEYEYFFYKELTPQELILGLNDFGEEGWEVVGVPSTTYFLLLKRPKNVPPVGLYDFPLPPLGTCDTAQGLKHEHGPTCVNWTPSETPS